MPGRGRPTSTGSAKRQLSGDSSSLNAGNDKKKTRNQQNQPNVVPPNPGENVSAPPPSTPVQKEKEKETARGTQASPKIDLQNLSEQLKSGDVMCVLTSLVAAFEALCTRVSSGKQRDSDLAERVNHLENENEDASRRISAIEEDFSTITDENAKGLKVQRELLNSLLSRVSKLEKENKALKEKMNDFENRNKRDNLILRRIPEHGDPKNETEDVLVDWIRKWLDENPSLGVPGAELEYVRVHRLGEFAAGRKRNVVIKFDKYRQKNLIWKNRASLKDSRSRDKIYVEEHFAFQTSQDRRVLQIYQQALRLKNVHCNIVVDSLIVEGIRYKNTPEDLARLDLKYEQILGSFSLREDAATLAFFGRFHKFSNHYKTKMMVQGTTYSSNEQFYYAMKAQKVGNLAVMGEIMKTNNPGEIKRLSKKLQDTPAWKKSQVDVMRKGLQCKFSQNAELKEALLATGNKLIAESSAYDLFWGTGINLRSDMALNAMAWKGQNMLGKLLVELRESLRG